MAALELWLTGSVVLAMLWPTLLGHTREAEQSRESRLRLSQQIGRTIHPSDVRYWSSHRVNEWLAWVVGAALAVGVYALI
jgi:hypothetical protein